MSELPLFPQDWVVYELATGELWVANTREVSGISQGRHKQPSNAVHVQLTDMLYHITVLCRRRLPASSRLAPRGCVGGKMASSKTQ